MTPANPTDSPCGARPARSRTDAGETSRQSESGGSPRDTDGPPTARRRSSSNPAEARQVGAPAENDDLPLGPAKREVISYRALANVPSLSDAGKQFEVVPIPGDLTPGVPDSVVDFCTVDPFEVRACSSRGWSHRHMGTPRQDSFAIAATPDWLVIAVADGVSAATHSHMAAETASRAAVKQVAHGLQTEEDVDWDLVARRISMALAREAEFRGLTAAQSADESIDTHLRRVRAVAATTLIVAALSRREGPDDAFSGWIANLAGDSAGYLLGDGSMTPSAGGKNRADGITSTSVRPLPGSAEPDVHEIRITEGEGIMLVSDGISDPLGDGSGDLGVALGLAWATPPPIEQFLVTTNFLRRSYDDDRTAVGVWLLPPQTQEAAMSSSQGNSAVQHDSGIEVE